MPARSRTLASAIRPAAATGLRLRTAALLPLIPISVTVLLGGSLITRTVDPFFQLLTVAILRLILFPHNLPELLAINSAKRGCIGADAQTACHHKRGKRDGIKGGFERIRHFSAC